MPTTLASISSLSTTEKLQEVFTRSGKYVGPDAQQMLEQMITRRALEIMAATMVAWGVAQLFGVGELVDVIMLAVGVVALGKNGIEFASDLVTASSKTIRAKSEADLDEAAQYLGKAIVEAGVEVILALLMRKDLGEIKIKIKRLQTMRPHLLPAGPAPLKGPLKISFQKTLGTGNNVGWVRGETDPFGRITIAREGYVSVPGPNGPTAVWTKFTAEEKYLTILHEMVHRFFSPRFGTLLEFRASAGMTAYQRLYLLKYLEEALAEGYAQTRANGVSGIWSGISFPIKNNYVKISMFSGTAGAASSTLIGVFYVSGKRYYVRLEPRSIGKPVPHYEWLPATR